MSSSRLRKRLGLCSSYRAWCLLTTYRICCICVVLITVADDALATVLLALFPKPKSSLQKYSQDLRDAKDLRERQFLNLTSHK